jgi:NADPH:quinone reductase-like Zn-dependent oxidoreductase
MVKVVRMHAIGEADVMRVDDLNIEGAQAGEALVRIEAIGLNRGEALYRRGRYITPPPPLSRLGLEGIGVIESVGPGVTAFAPGQRVAVLPNFAQGQYGVYAEKAVLPVSALAPALEGVPAIEEAASWMQYLTAFGLMEAGGIKAGDYVIVPAASSSVGLAAIQIANWAGAIPIAATRTPAKSDALRALGAAHVVTTEGTDLEAEIARITGGAGAKVVFDPVGGPFVETWAKCMAQHGVLIIYGSLSGQPTPYPHRAAANKGLSLRGWMVAEITLDPARLARYRALMQQGLRSGRLKPVIDRVFPLDQIVEAHRHLESNQQIGKIVVTV